MLTMKDILQRAQLEVLPEGAEIVSARLSWEDGGPVWSIYVDQDLPIDPSGFWLEYDAHTGRKLTGVKFA
ncbi:MAG: hypothetical protein AAFU79_13925 [Myxococcota bacterium]